MSQARRHVNATLLQDFREALQQGDRTVTTKALKAGVHCAQAVLAELDEDTVTCKARRDSVVQLFQDIAEHGTKDDALLSICKNRRMTDGGGGGFARVDGMEFEKSEVTKSFINPMLYSGMFPVAARGMLLFGPPGTGKTYLIKNLRDEILRQLGDRGMNGVTVNMYTVDATTLKGSGVGDTEKQTKAFFECVREDMRKQDGGVLSIVFIDELDAIAGTRESGSAGSKGLVNTLLTSMEGLRGDDAGDTPGRIQHLAVIGNTNYIDAVDSAFLRRIDNNVLYVGLPPLGDITDQVRRMEEKDTMLQVYMRCDEGRAKKYLPSRHYPEMMHEAHMSRDAVRKFYDREWRRVAREYLPRSLVRLTLKHPEGERKDDEARETILTTLHPVFFNGMNPREIKKFLITAFAGVEFVKNVHSTEGGWTPVQIDTRQDPPQFVCPPARGEMEPALRPPQSARQSGHIRQKDSILWARTVPEEELEGMARVHPGLLADAKTLDHLLAHRPTPREKAQLYYDYCYAETRKYGMNVAMQAPTFEAHETESLRKDWTDFVNAHEEKEGADMSDKEFKRWLEAQCARNKLLRALQFFHEHFKQ